jgi:hypothetical protein
MSTQYRTTGKMGLFDTEKQRAKLSSIGNPLEKNSKVVDFEMFRPALEEALLNHDKKSNVGEKLEQVYEKFKVEPQICERAYRNRPLSDEQKASNRVKSKTRSRVEHIFGFVTNSMHDFFSRCIGFRRIKGVIGLINLFYNMLRYEQIIRLQLNPVPVKS